MSVFNIKQTKDLAKKIAREMPARIYGLQGDLGAGKTTFVQAFLRELGVKGPITSPTFVLMKKYALPSLNKIVYHIDAYRLEKSKELLDLGFEKIVSDTDNVVLIEWADKIKSAIPKEALWLKFEYGEEYGERNIKIEK